MAWLMAIVMALTAAAAPTGQAGMVHAGTVRAGTAYGWPVAQVRVTRRFDPPPEPWLPGHRGVDLAGGIGVPVMAAASGTVSFAGQVAGRGVVSVVHPDGVKTTYEPLTPSVAAGVRVARGTILGTLDGGHCPAEACLHWGAKRGESYLDPLSLLGLGPIRLKPLGWTAAPAARPPSAARRRTTRRPGRRSAAARPSR